MESGSSVSPKAESVNGDTIEVKYEPSDDGDRHAGLSSTHAGLVKDEPVGSATNSPSLLPQNPKMSRSSSSSTVKSRATSASSVDKKEVGERFHESAAKVEPLHPLKPSHSGSQKVVPRLAHLFDHLEDATMEAKRSFTVLDACTYANKFLGYTEHAMECDCNEEWDAVSKQNTACGEDSDCINRATKMECVGDCGCGSGCQNQRFQRRQYADVSVIKTDKKGYGLRTNSDLRPGDFIFEYLGEVINEPQFRRRMVQYDEEGIKHFYFMSLSKGEFVDATRKGNLGRFCNHSCSPNCYVDKWVVGDKLRMGIFAERKIRAGEELVFNYNVDRYGANPQPCYCGEPNCTGFIGGKTQTERATKLSAATMEALGIDDGDSWDTTVAKKPRKKKAGEEDEEYVESVEAKSLDTDGVTKVMAALMQCKEKWIAVKLLQRIQRCHDEQVRNRVVKMHGYQILNSQLAAWKDDVNVVIQILDILDKFPRLTRNKIIDSKIESTLELFTANDDERVSSQATTLLDQWSKLEVAYRIPRKKRDANESATPQKQESHYERRESAHERKRSRSRSRSRTPPRGPSTSSAPSGPRSSLPQRNTNFYPPRPPPFHRPIAALPRGWFQASDNGKTYYYSADGQTTWTRPTQPAAQPPPPPKQPSNQDVLKSIIDNIVSAREKERDTKNTTPETPQPQTKDKKEKKEEKWRSYDEAKKKKLYENTLFPHISHVMNKYKAKIPRDDLKRFAKEIAKKLVESDFKGGRVEDPSKISDKHQQKVKKYCKDFFEKAAYKHSKHEKEKAAKRVKSTNGTKPDIVDRPAATSSATPPTTTVDGSPDLEVKKEDDSEDEDVKMSEDEPDEEKATPASPVPQMQNGDILKRKRSRSEDSNINDDDDLTKSPLKKLNLDSPPPPPPPPPAPPVDTPNGTPGESEDASPAEISLYADTSFKSKSMADVLAEAQQDTGDDADMSMEDANTALEKGLKENGRPPEDAMLGKPMMDGQVMEDEDDRHPG